MKKETKIALALKIIAVIASIYGMCRNFDDSSFTYFTNLSNVFMDVMLVISIINDIVKAKKEKGIMSNKTYLVKFLATISITLTFLVYMLILAPTYDEGFITAYLYNGAGSLCVHFVMPILAIIDFILFDKAYKSENKHVFYAIIPPLLYVGFVIILMENGYVWRAGPAPYNFLNYKAPTGWFGFDLSVVNKETLGVGVFYMIILLSAIFVGLGKLYLKVRKKEEE